MSPTVLADPLGAGTLATAVADMQALITGTYVPVLIGAILFGVALAVGFRWLRRSVSTVGRGR